MANDHRDHRDCEAAGTPAGKPITNGFCRRKNAPFPILAMVLVDVALRRLLPWQPDKLQTAD